jgi:dolichol-phosphate mannosyltransferase
MNLDLKIKSLKGPILVIGASGFVGANVLRAILKVREDAIGTVFSGSPWRLRGIPPKSTLFLNLQDPVSVYSVFSRVRPATVFDCSSFGGYSFEKDIERIHATNYLSFIRLMEEAPSHDLAAYVHAGSSSEYGLNASGSDEADELMPNSHYAVSKAAASQAVRFYGKMHGLPVANLRLYSVYGPYEDSSRLIPVLCEKSLRGELPSLAGPGIARDFIHVDDVTAAFISTALNMRGDLYGESFNIGTGVQTTLQSLALLAKELFQIEQEPQFDPNMGRSWDLDRWFAKIDKARHMLDWEPEIGLADGLATTRDWWKEQLAHEDFSRLTKKQQARREKSSVSAIIACYKDAQAIPVMYERLVTMFSRCEIDYEIIFVNDNSPDASAEIIRDISAADPRVLGITHSRNFGSQAAFRSGMELASKEACVLLDGDLQDPPEVIEKFIEKWREGADVVYGRRIKREMPRWLETCYRGFYRLFAAMSEVPIPRDAGDFSLMDRSVVYWLLQCNERDAFLRGLRAYVGFNQVGVDYVRPDRMFGVSTNNWIKNIGWAKKGIFSFSRMPLHVLTAFGGLACVGTVILAITSIAIRIIAPEAAPRGVTFISLLVMFFGSSMILGLGLLGEYIGKIFEEAKARPMFIRRHIIARGEIKPAETRKVL